MCSRCGGLTIDSLLIDWKLTVLYFFLHGFFVLKYADSSNRRGFFLHGSLVLRICPIESVNTRDYQTLSQQEQTFFLQSSSLFLRASVSKSNLSLYLLYYAEACNEIAGPISASLRPGNTASFEEMAQRWQAVGNTVPI